MAPPTTVVSWEEVDRLAERLARAWREAGARFDRVVGVARGGLVPAVLLAAHLEVRRVEAVQVRHYDGRRRLPAPAIVGPAPVPAGPAGRPSGTLVVDDVHETGGTLAALRTALPDAAYAVLVAKADGLAEGPHGTVLVEVAGGGPPLRAGRIAPPGRWVVFPWSGSAEAAR